MSLVAVVMLGMAVSFDGFGVGFAYGLRRLRIPPVSLLIICASSALSIFISMVAGRMIVQLFSPEVGSALGSAVLISLGFFFVWQSLQKESVIDLPGSERDGSNEKGFSYLSRVLREPCRADFDKSGVITGREAVVLGAALAMDAFGAGFGAAMLGFAPLATALGVGLIKLTLITMGLQLGKRYSENISGERATVFAGLVLILLGMTHFFI